MPLVMMVALMSPISFAMALIALLLSSAVAVGMFGFFIM
jgi:hypothetical protein